MKQVYRFDIEGYLLETVLLEEGEAIPEDCIDIPPTGIKPKLKADKTGWENGMTEEEVDELINAPIPLTLEEQLIEKEREIKRLQTQTELMNADLAALMDALTESGVL